MLIKYFGTEGYSLQIYVVYFLKDINYMCLERILQNYYK